MKKYERACEPSAGERKLSSIPVILILLQMCTSPAAGLNELDWWLGSSKCSSASVSNETAFHGASCAELKFTL